MLNTNRPTVAEIDLEALCHNLEQARKFCQPGQKILAVVKADAYGHGAIPVSRALETAGVEHFAVATLEEGVELRRAGLEKSLLVLGGCFPGQEADFHRYHLMPVLFDLQSLQRLEDYAGSQSAEMPVQIKFDTGMGRIGFRVNEFSPLCRVLKGLKWVRVEGLMSHLACADEDDNEVTEAQIALFRDLLARFKEQQIEFRNIHINNSAGLSGWQLPECTHVRPGIMLYGGMPGEKYRSQLDLRPVMHLRTRIAQLKTVPAGTGISYGHTYHTSGEARIAVLPLGYADGYNRLLSGQGEGMIRGQRVPIVGRVCMDWILADVTALPEVAVGDQVTLLGQADGDCISGDHIAAQVGSISYEIFCRIGARVPRVYSEQDDG